MTPLVVLLLVQAVTSEVLSDAPCPSNLVQKVQTCFSDLARAVHAGSGPDTKIPNTGAGMTLDYSQIKQYCAENGHMARFVTCIEKLVNSCEDSPQSQLLDRLVSPQRVKQAVPLLCARQNEVESSSQCMNKAMTMESDCRAKSYAKIKAEMTLSARNATAMFLTQCTFFHSLAECQRKKVSENCGSELGDLHADFLLSFVPTSCIDSLVALTSHASSSKSTTSSTRQPTDSINRTRRTDANGDLPQTKKKEAGNTEHKMTGLPDETYKLVSTTPASNQNNSNSACSLSIFFSIQLCLVIGCLLLSLK